MSNRPTRDEFEAGKKWERPAAEALAQKLWPGSKVVEHQPHSHIDLAVVSPEGRFICQLEVKRRFVNHDTYPTTMVLWEKHDAARFTKRFFNAPTLCLIVFDDRVGFFHLENAPTGKEIKSRRDRPGSEKLYALYDVNIMVWQDDLLEPIRAAVAAIDAAKAAENTTEDDIPSI